MEKRIGALALLCMAGTVILFVVFAAVDIVFGTFLLVPVLIGALTIALLAVAVVCVQTAWSLWKSGEE